MMAKMSRCLYAIVVLGHKCFNGSPVHKSLEFLVGLTAHNSIGSFFPDWQVSGGVMEP